MGCASMAEDALRDLDIPYRRFDFSGGTLYFCGNPPDGSFNLSLHEGETARLWTFARTGLPPGRAGVKREYPGSRGVIGFEVTDEDDLNIYSRQSLAGTSPDRWKQLLLQQISDFLSLRARIRREIL